MLSISSICNHPFGNEESYHKFVLFNFTTTWRVLLIFFRKKHHVLNLISKNTENSNFESNLSSNYQLTREYDWQDYQNKDLRPSIHQSITLMQLATGTTALGRAEPLQRAHDACQRTERPAVTRTITRVENVFWTNQDLSQLLLFFTNMEKEERGPGKHVSFFHNVKGKGSR